MSGSAASRLYGTISTGATGASAPQQHWPRTAALAVRLDPHR
jgi:hypothetical protein